jgi:methionyl aminopeptidase
MIRIKTKKEIEILRDGGKKLALILDNLVKLSKPGVSTAFLEKEALRMMKEIGGRPAFKDLEMFNDVYFPSALCTSINDEVVHAPAIPGRILKNGDVLTIDIGMEYPLHGKYKNKYSELEGYYTDMARTVIIGEASDEIKKLVRVTKECLDLGIAQVKPGNNLNDIGRAIQKHAEKNGYSVVREMVGHGVGHEVHEAPQVPHYEVKDGSLEIYELKSGMVIAIEPMLNMGSWEIESTDDNFTFITKDGSLSAQFEHTIAITEKGHIIITDL